MKMDKIVRGKTMTRHQAWSRFEKERDCALKAYQIAIIKAGQETKSERAYDKALERADTLYAVSCDRIRVRYAGYGFR